MFKILALATLLLAVTCTSTGFEQVFAEVPESEFGTAVKSLLSMQMEDSAGRLQEISDLLYELQATLDQQQRDADTRIERIRTECDTSIQTLTKQLTDLQANIQDSKDEQSALVDEQAVKTRSLEDEKINHESTSQDLDQANLDLGEEGTKFTEYKASFEEAIAACEEAIRLMTQLGSGNPSSFIQRNKSSGVMFVQLSQKFSDVKNILENHVKMGGPAAFVQPIIDVLAELSTQAKVDVGKVDQIIELIQTLLTRLREGLIERTAQNTRTTNDLNSLISTLTSALTASGTQIGIYETRLSEIETRLGELSGVIANLEGLEVAQQQLLNNTQADCDEEESQYQSNTTKRTQSLALLDRLIQHFENQVVSTTSQVREGVVA